MSDDIQKILNTVEAIDRLQQACRAESVDFEAALKKLAREKPDAFAQYMSDEHGETIRQANSDGHIIGYQVGPIMRADENLDIYISSLADARRRNCQNVR